jgi:hypothetical protein
LSSCGHPPERSAPLETFTWRAQPISFSPPPQQWGREGETSDGLLGVRFVLARGGGQCMTVATCAWLADRDRRGAIAQLIARHDSLPEPVFLHEIGLARARTDDPLSDEDAAAALTVNAALDRAVSDYLDHHPGFVEIDLQAALQAAQSYEPTLAVVLPRLRLHPEAMSEPARWHIGYERDTTLAGFPAFASDDTLVTPERPLLYHEIFWVVNRCAFKASYQGTRENLGRFNSLVASIQFPDSSHALTR